ncbi:MAG: FecR family protein [Prolixibacteraceae bacterium]
MTTNKEHKKLSVDTHSKAFFTGGKFNWKKSEAEVWSNIEAIVDVKPAGRSLSFNFRKVSFAIAAAFLLLIGVGSFLRFYQITIKTPVGEHQLAQLPDGSTINLNAESTLKYNPYWWKFKREIHFEGEAYFEVEKGKKFSVISEKGIVQVLGTSFNIFARNEIYKVTCITGSVKVRSTTDEIVVLKPNSKAQIHSNGTIAVLHDIETYPEISWKNNLFLFTAVPIREVFYEIERQFGITIKTNMNTYALYTGNFSRDLDVEDVLSYVCPALGLDYTRKSAKEFVIFQVKE